MLRSAFIAASLLAGVAATPALATVGNPLAGMTAMSQYNAIVLGDWQASSDIEGKAVILGNATGGSATVGLGRSSQKAASSSAPTIIIKGSNSIGNLNVNNGANGASGTVATGPGALIGGNQTGNVNLNTPGKRSLIVGGDANGNFNVDSAQIGGNFTGGNLNPSSTGSIALGGTKTGGNMNLNGASFADHQAGLASSITSQVSSYTSSLSDDVKALSSSLAGLAASGGTLSSSGQTLILNATPGTNGYTVFNLSAADLTGFTSIAYNFDPNTVPVVVNFSGTNVNLGLNFVSINGVTDALSAVNQVVVWNFVNATNVTFNTEFFGSVLAPNASVLNKNAINGSLVAGSFNQQGEVHLGTFTPFTMAVPEPASWAMMIFGLGFVGAVMRRQSRMRVLLQAA